MLGMENAEKHKDGKDLPQYIGKNQLWALKIKEVDSQLCILSFEADYARMGTGAIYFGKHNPQPGSYWVRLEDGRETYCPREFFELTFTRLGM
jgi:hypothetical protein